MKAFLENLVEPEMAQAICQEHERRLRLQQEESALREAVALAGGRSTRAILAVMDSDLSQAEDLGAAAKEAVAAVKQSHPYLFGTGQVFASGTGRTQVTRPPTQQELAAMSMEEYRRYRKMKNG